MFEVDTQPQEASIEEGAPGDVTMSTTEQLKHCQEQIKRLETENKVLHGRIRGYKTLGDLLQEAKEENKKLSEEKKMLTQRLDTCSSIPESLTNQQLNNPEEREVPQNTELTQKSEETEQEDMTVTEVAEQPKADLIKERSVASIPEKTPPTDMPLEEACGSIREVTAMQESICETQNDLSRTNESEKSELKETNMMKNLELDSDRFDEPEYEKIGRQLAGKPVSMSSMSVISSGPDEKYNFPSLSSGTPQGGHDVRPKVYNDFDTKPSSLMSNSEMSLEMQRILHMTSIEGGQDLALKFRKMSEDIARTEENAKKYKSLAYTFAQENQKLKTSLTMEIKQTRNQNIELKEENKRLLALVTNLEHARDRLPQKSDSITSQTQVMDWVKLDKPRRQELDSELFQHAHDEGSLTGDMDSVMANIRDLRKQNKELKDANQSWNRRWQELTKEWAVKVEHMKAEVARHKQEVDEAMKREKQLKVDCEKLVGNAKSQAHEEESAKEDALDKLHQANNNIRTLQDQLAETEQRLDSLIREKHNLEAEISVLKSRSEGEDFTRNTPALPCQGDRSYDDLKTEIEVLRQQLTVFEEDFDRERQDRAAAQSARDELGKTLETVMHEKETLSRKVKQIDQKLKSQENVMQQALKRNENLQSQIRDSRNQNMQLLKQLQTSANTQPYLCYQPVPMYANQPMQGLTPEGQMAGVGLSPQSPQAAGFNYQYLPIQNQQMPFMNYQQVTPAPAPAETNTGKWTCHECTFANIPSRTVCEMCGRIRRQTGFASTGSSTTEPVLMSRDVVHHPPLSRGRDVPDENADLVTDNGLFL